MIREHTIEMSSPDGYNRKNFRPKLFTSAVNDVLVSPHDFKFDRLENSELNTGLEFRDDSNKINLFLDTPDIKDFDDGNMETNTREDVDILHYSDPDMLNYTKSRTHELPETAIRNCVRRLISDRSIYWTSKEWRKNVAAELNVTEISDSLKRAISKVVMEEAEFNISTQESEKNIALLSQTSLLSEYGDSPSNTLSEDSGELTVSDNQELPHDSTSSKKKPEATLKNSSSDIHSEKNSGNGKVRISAGEAELKAVRAVEAGPSKRARRILELTERDETEVEAAKAEMQNDLWSKVKKRLDPQLKRRRLKVLEELFEVKKQIQAAHLEEFVDGGLDDGLDSHSVELSDSDSDDDISTRVVSPTFPPKTQPANSVNVPRQSGHVHLCKGGQARRDLRMSLLTAAHERGNARKAQKVFKRYSTNGAKDMQLLFKYIQLRNELKGAAKTVEAQKQTESDLKRSEDDAARVPTADGEDEEFDDDYVPPVAKQAYRSELADSTEHQEDSFEEEEEEEEEEEVEEEDTIEMSVPELEDQSNVSETEVQVVRSIDGSQDITSERERLVEASPRPLTEGEGTSDEEDVVVVKRRRKVYSMLDEEPSSADAAGEYSRPAQSDASDDKNASQLLIETASHEEETELVDSDDDDDVGNGGSAEKIEVQPTEEITIPVSERDRNAEYRRLVLEEERKARKHKQSSVFVDEEAEEEEEGGLQGGLGDFGFGVPQLRKDDEEANALKIRKDDFDGIVDEISDNEGDEEEGRRARMEMEEKMDRKTTMDVIDVLRDGIAGARKRREKLGHFNRQELAEDDDEEPGNKEAGRAVEGYERDEEEELQRVMRGKIEKYKQIGEGGDFDDDDDLDDGNSDDEEAVDAEAGQGIFNNEEGLRKLLERAEKERDADGLIPKALAEEITEKQKELASIRAKILERKVRKSELLEERNRYRQFKRLADMRRTLKRVDTIHQHQQEDSIVDVPIQKTAGKQSLMSTADHTIPNKKRRTALVPSRMSASHPRAPAVITPVPPNKFKTSIFGATAKKPTLLTAAKNRPKSALVVMNTRSQPPLQRAKTVSNYDDLSFSSDMGLGVEEYRKRKQSAAEFLKLGESKTSNKASEASSSSRNSNGLFSAVVRGTSSGMIFRSKSLVPQKPSSTKLDADSNSQSNLSKSAFRFDGTNSINNLVQDAPKPLSAAENVVGLRRHFSERISLSSSLLDHVSSRCVVSLNAVSKLSLSKKS